MFKKRGVGIVAAMMLAGCTVGPNYEPPSPAMPVKWAPPTSAPSTQQSTTGTETPDVARWWLIFNDPTLNSLIERAIASNLDLRVAAARVRQARASRVVTRASLFPTVDSSGSYRRAGTANTARDLYQVGLDAAWELDIFGGNRRSVEASDADLRSAIESRRDVLVTLVSEVALNYIDLRAFQREVEVARQNVTAQQRSTDLTRQRNVAGFVGPLDTATAEASVASTEAQIPQFEALVRQTIYSLSVLVGQQPAALLDELSIRAPMPTVPARIPIGLPAELLRRRPDVRRAEADLHSATANIGVATAELFPRFSLTGAFSYQATRPARLFNWNNAIWSIGPSINWPVFDAGRIRANIEVQNAFQEQALATYEQTILTALQDVESAMVAYETEQRVRRLLVTAVDANRRALNISTQLYTGNVGPNTDFINVLNAQRSLFASETALVDSDRNIAANLVSLYKALGGGWEFELENPPTTQPGNGPD